MRPSPLHLAAPLLVVAVLAGAFWGSRAPQPAPVPGVSPPAPVAPTPLITVHVAGWVMNPGLVALPEGSRVADAVAGAGGLRPGADTTNVNLASVLADGEQVVIPGPGAEPAREGEPDPGDGLVHLNRATAAELETLPGVGPVLAERIVQYREEHGPFRTVEDLLDVPGIGEAKLASLREQVKVP